MNAYVLEIIYPVKHDIVVAQVVVSTSAKKARALANEKCGEEGKIWESKDLVTCKRIDLKKPGVKLQSFRNG